MYNDVDMVWLGDPFTYLEGKHDVYLTDDMAAVSVLVLLLVLMHLLVKSSNHVMIKALPMVRNV